MKDKLKKRIDRILEDEGLLEDVWQVVDSYLLDDINQMQMYSRILDSLEGDMRTADIIAWEVSDFVNEAA